jgi:hypothetical protein
MLIRIVEQAPLKATVFEGVAALQCLCQVFTAEEPASVGANKYDATAVAMIPLLKYGTGMPLNRMKRQEGQLRPPLPAATQWELGADRRLAGTDTGRVDPGNENFREIVLNSLVWIARGEVPKDGVKVSVRPSDLDDNLDPKRQPR